MTKAWDVKELAAKLKARGLDVAEDTAGYAAEEVFNWIEESVKLTENKIDDIALPFLPEFKARLKVLIDKVDGQVG